MNQGICRKCGKPTRQSMSSGRFFAYCSHNCQKKWSNVRSRRRKAQIKIKKVIFYGGYCATCHNPMMGSAAHMAGRKFCSDVCRRKGARVIYVKKIYPTTQCLWCSSTFEIIPRHGGTKYCSFDCSLAHRADIKATKARQQAELSAKRRQQREWKRKASKIKTCKTCSVQYTPIVWTSYIPAHYCSEECYLKGKIGAKKWPHAKSNKRHKAIRRSKKVNRIAVFEACNWRCKRCDASTPAELIGSNDPYEPTLDHIVPLAKGGEHSYENCQLLCRSCNTNKGSGHNQLESRVVKIEPMDMSWVDALFEEELASARE